MDQLLTHASFGQNSEAANPVSHKGDRWVPISGGPVATSVGMGAHSLSGVEKAAFLSGFSSLPGVKRCNAFTAPCSPT